MGVQRVSRTRTIDIDSTLRKVFEKKSFRPLQREIIETALDGKDVYVQAATSFGKSLCYQLPAVTDYGITIVVSPLLALMRNQVAGLERNNVKVATINSTIAPNEKKDIMTDLLCGHPNIRLLYVTPEFCVNEGFRRSLRMIYENSQLARIAIDEAHCISEWGHDFRPSFMQLNYFRKEFPDVPIFCCTATATDQVRHDIISTLGLRLENLATFTMSTHRANLHYEVRFKHDNADPYDDFLKYIRGVHKRRRNDPARAAELCWQGQRLDNVSGIIYTLKRDDCEAIASRLSADGIGAKPYHAKLPVHIRDENLAGWQADRPGFDVMVATTAFGMGIDKENVRFVIHWQLPKSFEGFYQEAGRAGRDGKASICILYYSREDRDRAHSMMQREIMMKQNQAQRNQRTPSEAGLHVMHNRVNSLKCLVDYCESTRECRHAIIARYFKDPTVPACEWACDWHKDAVGLARRFRTGLASEEWCSTQRQMGVYDEYDDYE